MAATNPENPSREIKSARSRLESITLRMLDAGLPPEMDEDEEGTSEDKESMVDAAKRLGALDLRLEILRRSQKD